MTGESALDKAVKRDRVDIFIALIRLGAGIRINVDAAQAFMEKYIKHPEMAKTSQILAGEKPELAYRVAIGALATSTMVDKKHNLLVGADHGPLYLQGSLYPRVFDDKGHLLATADEGFGRRTVVLIAQGQPLPSCQRKS